MKAKAPSPLAAVELVDEYFIENRHKLLDVAAFLDRLDAADSAAAARDFRMKAFADAVLALASGTGDRVERIQMIFSDPTTEPIPRLDRKAARGAYEGRNAGGRS